MALKFISRKTQNELDLKVSKTDYDIQVETLQPKNAPTLETTSKDIVLAINEVNALAKKGGSGDNPITITKTEGINVIDEELATLLYFYWRLERWWTIGI